MHEKPATKVQTEKLKTTKSAQEKLREEHVDRGAEQLTPKSRELLIQKAEGIRRMMTDTEARQQRERKAWAKSQSEDIAAVARLSGAFGKELPSIAAKVHEEGASLVRLMKLRDERDGDTLREQLEATESDLGSGDSREMTTPHPPDDEVVQTSKERMPDLRKETSAKSEKPTFYSIEELRNRFPVPEGFFDLPSHRVLFDQAKTILCGELQNVSVEEAAYAESFLEALTGSEIENPQNIEEENALRANSDAVLTQQLREAMVPNVPSSKLRAQREALGIHQADDEKPFDIIVVRSPEEAHTYHQKEKAWMERTGSPSQFMYRDSEDRRTPTIFLPDFEANALLDPNNPSSDSDLRMVEHEYRHTQRRFSYGHDRLFRLIDEVCTNVTGYGKETALLGVLSFTTPELRGKDFKAAYESGDEKKKAELLNKFAESFGPKGLLLLGGKKSSEHSGENDGLKNLPLDLTEGAEADENVRFAESLLKLRAEQSPDFLKTLEQRIGQSDVKRATLEAWANMFLVPYLPKNASHNAGLLSQLVERLQEEIKRRELTGEKGLYDD